MTSILEVEQLDTLSSNASSTLTIGGTNTTTLNLGSNITGGSITNTPMFHTYLSAHQTVSHNTFTKFQGNVVVKDTDSAYDNPTTYRWTCPSGKGGTYLFWWNLFIHYSGNTITNDLAVLRKNGSTIAGTQNNNGVNVNDGSLLMVPISGTFVVDVSAGDYIELFGYGSTSNSGNFLFISSSLGWGGMKVIGA